jgi:hypothetical protein
VIADRTTWAVIRPQIGRAFALDIVSMAGLDLMAFAGDLLAATNFMLDRLAGIGHHRPAVGIRTQG